MLFISTGIFDDKPQITTANSPLINFSDDSVDLFLLGSKGDNFSIPSLTH